MATISQQQEDTYVRRDDSVEGLLAGLVDGDRYALARAITLGKRIGTRWARREHSGCRNIDNQVAGGVTRSTFTYSHALNFPNGFQGNLLQQISRSKKTDDIQWVKHRIMDPRGRKQAFIQDEIDHGLQGELGHCYHSVALSCAFIN